MPVNEELIDSFRGYLRVERGLPDKSIAAYELDLQQFVAWLFDKPLPTVDHNDVRRYFGWCLDSGIGARTVQRKFSSFRSFWRFLCIDRHCKVNPMDRVQTPKAWKTLPKYFPERDIETILGQKDLSFRERAILELLYGLA
jgi:integrase/recombinase XerD